MDIPPCSKKLSFLTPSHISRQEMEQHEIRQRAKSFHFLSCETPLTSLMQLSQGMGSIIYKPLTIQKKRSSHEAYRTVLGPHIEMQKQVVQLQDGRPRAKSFTSKRQRAKRSLNDQDVEYVGEVKHNEYFGKRLSSMVVANPYDISMLTESLSDINFQQTPFDISSLLSIYKITVRKYKQFLYLVFQNLWHFPEFDFVSSCLRQLQIPSYGEFPVPSMDECQTLIQLSEKMRIAEVQSMTNCVSTTNYNYYPGLPTMENSNQNYLNFPEQSDPISEPIFPSPYLQPQYPTMSMPGRKIGTCTPPKGWSTGMLAAFLSQATISKRDATQFNRKRPVEEMATTEYLYFKVHDAFACEPPNKMKRNPLLPVYGPTNTELDLTESKGIKQNSYSIPENYMEVAVPIEQNEPSCERLLFAPEANTISHLSEPVDIGPHKEMQSESQQQGTARKAIDEDDLYAGFMKMLEEDKNNLRKEERRESTDSGFSSSDKNTTRNNSVASENGSNYSNLPLYQITEEDKNGELWRQINTMDDPDDLARAVVSNISESALADLRVEDIDNFEMNPYDGGRMATDGLLLEFTMDADIPNV